MSGALFLRYAPHEDVDEIARSRKGVEGIANRRGHADPGERKGWLAAGSLRDQALQFAGDEIIELKREERAENRDQPEREEGGAPAPIGRSLHAEPAGINDERDGAEIDEIERLPDAVKDVACEQQPDPALRDR
ncbi:MAG: hypothetical protein R6X05_05810 [Desulfobacterales bacterium]